MMQLPPYFDRTRYPDQQMLLRNEHCVFLALPERDVLPGSGLIVPLEARETVFDLTPAEWAATFELLQAVKQLLDEKYQPDGYNVGWNAYRVGGQSIPQAHLHVIPRFADEPLAGKGLRHHLKQPDNRRRESAS
jgi:diadenosine tetraphosphate (Ap4A) HIT family hydrolase